MQDNTQPQIAARDRAMINEVHIEPEIEGAYANAWINIEVENLTREDQQALASVVVKIGEIQEKIDICEVIKPEGGVIETVIRIEEPELWWPCGYGAQPLYECLVGVSVKGVIEDVASHKFGVRSVRILEDQANLRLLVNGEEIIADESVWAPADQFVIRASRERYQKLVAEALDAGAVMIRAWGTGSAEDSAFYDVCDEMGMLVWQELAPNMSSRPNGDFQEMALDIVTQQIENLRNHPSIVAWCGSMGGQTESEAGKLLTESIPALLKDMDRARPYFVNCRLPN